MSLKSLRRQRDRMVRAAERASGFKEGGFVHELADGSFKGCQVTVSFYGGVTWWIEIEGQPKQKLTPELWARTQKLRL